MPQSVTRNAKWKRPRIGRWAMIAAYRIYFITYYLRYNIIVTRPAIVTLRECKNDYDLMLSRSDG